jgi:hypothetical protein
MWSACCRLSRSVLCEGGSAAAPARGLTMPEVLSAPGAGTRPLLIVGAGVALLVGAALALWAHYGTAVFYEMIVAGIALCF